MNDGVSRQWAVVVRYGMRRATRGSLSSWILKAAGLSCSTTTARSNRSGCKWTAKPRWRCTYCPKFKPMIRPGSVILWITYQIKSNPPQQGLPAVYIGFFLHCNYPSLSLISPVFRPWLLFFSFKNLVPSLRIRYSASNVGVTLNFGLKKVSENRTNRKLE